MGDVAKQTKARYCTEYNFVNAEAKWIESLTLTLGGLPAIHRYGAEVSRGHSKPATSCNPIQRAMQRTHKRTKD